MFINIAVSQSVQYMMDRLTRAVFSSLNSFHASGNFLLSADNLCKQFATLIVFMKVNFEKSQQTTTKE